MIWVSLFKFFLSLGPGRKNNGPQISGLNSVVLELFLREDLGLLDPLPPEE